MGTEEKSSISSSEPADVGITPTDKSDPSNIDSFPNYRPLFRLLLLEGIALILLLVIVFVPPDSASEASAILRNGGGSYTGVLGGSPLLLYDAQLTWRILAESCSGGSCEYLEPGTAPYDATHVVS